jgi:HTH-type transcriptional regulator, transcriptional repressor of NAD biosynthesis genes
VSKRFQRGLVVGKFCPLHNGHVYVIQQAMSVCDEIVLISYTKPEFEHCARDTREGWLTRQFSDATVLVIDDEFLLQLCVHRAIADVQTIPCNDASDDVHRRFVAWLCLSVLHKPVDAVFTSEGYGDGFAEILTAQFHLHSPLAPVVQHVCVDAQRKVVPVSGTRIRLNPHDNRQFLSSDVYASFVERVSILGGESSGKSTLAQALAERLGTAWVPEYGRELWERQGGKLVLDDMVSIGRQQLQNESALAQTATRFLLCDTSPLTTMFYSHEMFGVVEPELVHLAGNRYDHVFVCAPDFEFVQDGTRRDPAFRENQHRWYLAELSAREQEFCLLEGPLETRLLQAISYLQFQSELR